MPHNKDLEKASPTKAGNVRCMDYRCGGTRSVIRVSGSPLHKRGASLMALCEYERAVLACIVFGDVPDDPGAAWWAACEALAGRGLLEAGKATDKGRMALVMAKEGALE